MSQKLLDAAVYILQQQPTGRMNRLRHAKMLYFADCEYARSFGNGDTFTGRYTRMHKGPVPVGYFDALKGGTPPNALFFLDGNDAALTDAGRGYAPVLSDEERACITITLEEFPASREDYVDRAYETEPMVGLIQKYPSEADQLNKHLDFDLLKRYEIFDTARIDTSFVESGAYDAYLKAENE